MKIKKQLKYGSFEWDDETKAFKITQGEQTIKLSKVYTFAFVRFVLRMAQRNWFRKVSSPKVTIEKLNEVTSLENNKLDSSVPLPTDKVMLVQQEEGMEVEQYEFFGDGSKE